jgi:hypothetical protein
MSEALSPKVKRLVQQYLDGKEFHSVNDVLMAALRLFEQYRSYQNLRADVKEGVDQIERGDAVNLGNDQELLLRRYGALSILRLQVFQARCRQIPARQPS